MTLYKALLQVHLDHELDKTITIHRETTSYSQLDYGSHERHIHQSFQERPQIHQGFRSSLQIHHAIEEGLLHCGPFTTYEIEPDA